MTIAIAASNFTPLDGVGTRAAHATPATHSTFASATHISRSSTLSHILREYKRTGFLTAIDDFGAGYAGLHLLTEFQPDIVKLDMNLVRGVDASRPRQAIVGGVLEMCRELNITVLAEGAETEGERDFFLNAGVTRMQGCLFARPAFQARGIVDASAWG